MKSVSMGSNLIAACFMITSCSAAPDSQTDEVAETAKRRSVAESVRAHSIPDPKTAKRLVQSREKSMKTAPGALDGSELEAERKRVAAEWKEKSEAARANKEGQSLTVREYAARIQAQAEEKRVEARRKHEKAGRIAEERRKAEELALAPARHRAAVSFMDSYLRRTQTMHDNTPVYVEQPIYRGSLYEADYQRYRAQRDFMHQNAGAAAAMGVDPAHMAPRPPGTYGY